MKNFLKYTLATIVGSIIASLLFLFIFIGIIAAIGSGDEKEVTVEPNSILKIDIGEITDREPLNPFADFSFGDEDDAKVSGLNKILAALDAAAKDDRIAGVYIKAEDIEGGGISDLQAIRARLQSLKDSGKFVYAYGETYSQRDYYMASMSDSVFLNPLGSIELTGMGAQLMFFKNMLDKLGVEMQIIRGPNNKFKSAVEPFMYDKMSDANREQMNTFMGSVWHNLATSMAASRNISYENFNMYVDSLYASNANKAKELGLIDGIYYEDQVLDALMSRVKVKKEEDIKWISLADYASTVHTQNATAKEKIAVIYAVGEIQSGEGSDEIIGSDRIAKAIKEARQDSSIKAIVLRVNSPGGSALASEVMYRELVLAKEVKPLVVSMGNYAASGGYYISCMAHKIVAQPNTLTGSIGVFGMIPNAQKLMNEKLGITTDEVATNANSNFGIFKPLSPYQIKTIQNEVVKIYDTFVSHVAEGRGMTVAKVDSMGQGRVWSGTNALELGLVDELGGLDRAISIAAEMAKVKIYKVSELPERINPFEQMIKEFKGGAKARILKSEMGAAYPLYQNYLSLQNMEGVQARLPFFLEIY